MLFECGDQASTFPRCSSIAQNIFQLLLACLSSSGCADIRELDIGVDDGTKCGARQLACSGVCKNVRTDVKNCGSCKLHPAQSRTDEAACVLHMLRGESKAEFRNYPSR